MQKIILAALLGGVLAGPAFAQSGGGGGLSGGSPGSPGAGGNAGTSTPDMGAAGLRSVPPGVQEGAPLAGTGRVTDPMKPLASADASEGLSNGEMRERKSGG